MMKRYHRSMRNKEEAEDYRYFPDWISRQLYRPCLGEEIKKTLPEMPEQAQQRIAG